MPPASVTPEFSVVIPVRRAVETAGDTVGRLLEREGLEIITVVSSEDPTAASLRELQGGKRHFVLLEIPGDHSVPQLRAHGIRAAQGRFVAITEDHCELSPGWPRIFAAALNDPTIGAAGGAVANGRRDSLADWAIYFSRYAALMPPLQEGPAPVLPGNNACYRREVLESSRELYEDAFREYEFHQYLRQQGWKLIQVPSAVATHRKPYRFGSYLVLRFYHGRCFSGMIRETRGHRAVAARVLFSPLTPFLLAWRAARAVAAKRSHRSKFCFALPLLLLCYAAWTAGEVAGCLFGPGRACSQTD